MNAAHHNPESAPDPNSDLTANLRPTVLYYSPILTLRRSA